MKKILMLMMMITFGIAAHAQHDHHKHHPAKPKETKKAEPNQKAKPAQKDTVQKKPAHPAEEAKPAAADTTIKKKQEPHAHPDTAKSAAPPQHQHEQHTAQPQEEHQHQEAQHHMPHAFSRNLPMTRNGSGTSWLPDSSPMYGYMMHAGKWNMMVHGSIYPRYTNHDVFEAGTRGGSKWDAPNWFMLMANRETGKKGLFNFNFMFSLDPITEGGEGYPLLFQSGETWNGQPLVDRQHPHDLIDELSIAYTHMINKDVDITGYLGYPGEPALGPPAFMHRVSTENNPDAPLSHHWQDPTHITFGVATLGLRYKMFKLEGSSFTGREPDENRYDFDEPRFDSWSVRLLANPHPHWAMQVSNGFIKSPETLEPDEDIRRTTASVIHTKPLSRNSYAATSAVWGANASDELSTSSFLLESNWQLRKNAVYGRYEYIQKSAHELVIDAHHEEGGGEPVFNVNALTLGANRIIFEKYKTQIRLGAQGTFYKTDERLIDLYGEYPVAAEVYFRINPAMMR